MAKNTELDRLDLRILHALQTDGRITNRELAELVNLSPSACHQRLQKLLDDGWVRGFNAVVDIDRLCAPVQCIANLVLGTHAPNGFRDIEQHITDMPEALEAYTVSGASDFIIHFACANMSRYLELTDQLLRDCPAITNISTHIIMRKNKQFRGFPLKELLPPKSL
jgi:DNA-binding Lrp family transcriptional regulator